MTKEAILDSEFVGLKVRFADDRVGIVNTCAEQKVSCRAQCSTAKLTGFSGDLSVLNDSYELFETGGNNSVFTSWQNVGDNQSNMRAGHRANYEACSAGECPCPYISLNIDYNERGRNWVIRLSATAFCYGHLEYPDWISPNWYGQTTVYKEEFTDNNYMECKLATGGNDIRYTGYSVNAPVQVSLSGKLDIPIYSGQDGTFTSMITVEITPECECSECPGEVTLTISGMEEDQPPFASGRASLLDPSGWFEGGVGDVRNGIHRLCSTTSPAGLLPDQCGLPDYGGDIWQGFCCNNDWSTETGSGNRRAQIFTFGFLGSPSVYDTPFDVLRLYATSLSYTPTGGGSQTAYSALQKCLCYNGECTLGTPDPDTGVRPWCYTETFDSASSAHLPSGSTVADGVSFSWTAPDRQI